MPGVHALLKSLVQDEALRQSVNWLLITIGKRACNTSAQACDNGHDDVAAERNSVLRGAYGSAAFEADGK